MALTWFDDSSRFRDETLFSSDLQTRETVYSALFAIASAAYPWASAPSRRLKLWERVALEDMPALFQTEGEAEVFSFASGTVLSSQTQTIRAYLWAYINAKDENVIGATQINNIIDSIVTALRPTGAGRQTGKNSLGGLVDNCRIAGVPFKDPGDLDGIGVVIINVEIVLP